MALSSSGPVRVVMVVRLFDPWIGGMERQAVKLARALIDSGTAEARIVTGRWFPRTPRHDVSRGVPVFRHQALWGMAGYRGGRTLGAYAYMMSLLFHLWRTRRTYDVIHVHGLSYHTFAASIAARISGKPVLVKLANSGAASDLGKMRRGSHLRGTERMLPHVLRCDRFVALNRTIEDELVAAGVPPERIVRIPNGVDVPDVSVDPTSSQGPPRLVYVGRLHPQKRLDLLLAALADTLVASASDPPVLDIVGDGPLRADLVAQARELGLQERVVFHGQQTDAAAFMAGADVFVLPSAAEGLSNALLEAMAIGLPVVASDIEGNVDVLSRGGGILFPSGDSGGLAEAIDRLLSDPDLRMTLGDDARRVVREHYSIDEVALRYGVMYRELTTQFGEVVSNIDRGVGR